MYSCLQNTQHDTCMNTSAPYTIPPASLVIPRQVSHTCMSWACTVILRHSQRSYIVKFNKATREIFTSY